MGRCLTVLLQLLDWGRGEAKKKVASAALLLYSTISDLCPSDYYMLTLKCNGHLVAMHRYKCDGHKNWPNLTSRDQIRTSVLFKPRGHFFFLCAGADGPSPGRFSKDQAQLSGLISFSSPLPLSWLPSSPLFLYLLQPWPSRTSKSTSPVQKPTRTWRLTFATTLEKSHSTSASVPFSLSRLSLTMKVSTSLVEV